MVIQTKFMALVMFEFTITPVVETPFVHNVGLTAPVEITDMKNCGGTAYVFEKVIATLDAPDGIDPDPISTIRGEFGAGQSRVTAAAAQSTAIQRNCRSVPALTQIVKPVAEVAVIAKTAALSLAGVATTTGAAANGRGKMIATPLPAEADPPPD